MSADLHERIAAEIWATHMREFTAAPDTHLAGIVADPVYAFGGESEDVRTVFTECAERIVALMERGPEWRERYETLLWDYRDAVVDDTLSTSRYYEAERREALAALNEHVLGPKGDNANP